MTDSITPGKVLAGKFRIERVLGQGGMGVVVQAHHLVLDEPVALKFLLSDAMMNGEAVARFEREARAAVKIKSEHVARVSDVGRLEDGAPYMVMELLRGRDLGALLVERGPMPLEDVVDYLLQAGEAIAEAHGLGIVHRDLKPQNLFLTQRADGSPCVKVLDFGISKLTGAGSGSGNDAGMTRTSAVMGSPLYMSPEQLLSARDVDMRTDVWALGVICFELLTGKSPFMAETLPQLCMTITHSPPASLRGFRPDLPLELERLILRCLEKDRGRRVATVAELALALVQFAPRRARLSAERIERLARAAGFTASALALPPSSGGEAHANTASQPLASQTANGFGATKPSTSSGGRVALSLGAVALLAAGAAFAWLHRGTAPIAEPALPSAAAAAPASDATGALPPAASAVASADTTAELAASTPPVVVPAVTGLAAPLKPKHGLAAAAQPTPVSMKPGAQSLPVKPIDPKPKPAQDGLGGRL
ncbi:MAG TPA: serine/threonine-protein kinase [Polyangiaceae bacterium]|jgi:serine/threonine-protein kinase